MGDPTVELARGAALPVTAFVAAMPAVVLYVARVTNDALAVPLITLALITILRAYARENMRAWAIAGATENSAIRTSPLITGPKSSPAARS